MHCLFLIACYLQEFSLPAVLAYHIAFRPSWSCPPGTRSIHVYTLPDPVERSLTPLVKQLGLSASECSFYCDRPAKRVGPHPPSAEKSALISTAAVACETTAPASAYVQSQAVVAPMPPSAALGNGLSPANISSTHPVSATHIYNMSDSYSASPVFTPAVDPIPPPGFLLWLQHRLQRPTPPLFRFKPSLRLLTARGDQCLHSQGVHTGAYCWPFLVPTPIINLLGAVPKRQGNGHLSCTSPSHQVAESTMESASMTSPCAIPRSQMPWILPCCLVGEPY